MDVLILQSVSYIKLYFLSVTNASGNLPEVWRIVE